MPPEIINNHSKIHGDLEARVSELEKDKITQWKKIDGMRTRSIVTLTAVVFILAGVVTNLIISWPK